MCKLFHRNIPEIENGIRLINFQILDYAFPKDAKDIDCEPSTSQYEGCRCDD